MYIVCTKELGEEPNQREKHLSSAEEQEIAK